MTKDMTADDKRRERFNLARKTLEDKALQAVVGTNTLRINPFDYGQIAVNGAEDAYDSAMESEATQKVRKQLLQQARGNGRGLGVYGEPTISNYDVSAAIVQQVRESMGLLPLGDLGAVVEGLGKSFGFDFKVPDTLKDYVPHEIEARIQEAQLKALKSGNDPNKIDFSKVLNEKEADAYATYQKLSQHYSMYAAWNAARPNISADINAFGEELSKKYAPKETGKSGSAPKKK